MKRKQIETFDLIEEFVGKQANEQEESLITKQHVTENRQVIVKLADKAGIETGF